jgi:hypothetical protein
VSNLHRFQLEGFGGGKKKGQDGQSLRELEAGREAIKQLMAQPKSVRDARLARLSSEMAAMLEMLGPLDGQAGARLDTAKQIIDLLEQVSKRQ